ncbi:MAG TPA: glycosyltransferase family 39 protein, partial [Chloroflexota bacterium]
VPLAFLLHGLLFHSPLAGRATILSGLDDWLIYESSASDILLNGWLMDGGQGHGAPFYGQPLYPYVLALAHRLTGESVFGPLALQFASLGLVLVGAAVLARRAFGSRLDGLVALACLWLLTQLEAEHFKVARQLFNENLYMPLVMVSLTAVVSLARDRRPTVWWRAALVGGLLGLTVISRSQFLLFVPLGLLVLLLAWRQARLAALPPLLAMVAAVVLVIAPVTARNWVVSGQFVPISSSGGASLLEFHRPPPGLIDPTSLERDPLFQALRLDTQTRTVLAFVRADPGGYLATLLPLGAHSVGLQGRNDPGIYWPLFVTTLLYLASFALARTRRLHVWPIHVFIGTHLLVLMLFEADTYGYRLVMPMYAPMVVVAAQVPLALVRALLRSSPGAALRSGEARRATRFAAAGWAAIATVALLLQARGLIELWPQRDTALHGLGGPAAQAALTSDGVAAEAIYVASIDGTPRRFGAGNLTGLRYPWFKWFDPARSLPVPAGPGAAVYVLSELNGHTVSGGLVDCLGPPDASFQVVARAADVRGRCTSGLDAASSPVIFDGLARVDAVGVPATSEAGRPLETRLLWQPLVAHPDPQQLSLQLDDPQAGDGTQWGNGTLELYPARQWQPGEALFSRVPVDTDGTALPQAYRLTLGMTSTKPNAPPATALWQGARTDRVPVGAVTLTAGSGTTATKLPADMRALEGKSVSGGGLELIAARPLPSEMAIGGPLKIGLLWRALQDAPAAAQFRMRLLRADGEVVQESVLPVLGGRVSPSALRAGNVVRDEQTVLISARAPTETLALEVAVLDEGTRLGSIKMTGRAHTLDPSA